jgi:hypothetical protein
MHELVVKHDGVDEGGRQAKAVYSIEPSQGSPANAGQPNIWAHTRIHNSNNLVKVNGWMLVWLEHLRHWSS